MRKSLALVSLAQALICAGGPAVAETLTVADQKGQQRALLEAAGVEKGAPYTIAWTDFEAASPLLQALSAGAVDTGIAGDGPFLFAWGAGLPLRAAFLLPPRGAGHAVAVVAGANAPIHDPAGLSGKRIATGRGSIGHLLLLKLIQSGRNPPPAPQIVFLTPAQAKAALDAGSIDAWSTWEPYISLETVGGHGRVIADAAGLMPDNGFFVVNQTTYAAKRALLDDFYRRVTAAYAWGRSHQAEYAQILARQTGLPAEVARAVAEKTIATPAPITPQVVADEQPTLDAYRDAGLLHPAAPLASAFIVDPPSP